LRFLRKALAGEYYRASRGINEPVADLTLVKPLTQVIPACVNRRGPFYLLGAGVGRLEMAAPLHPLAREGGNAPDDDDHHVVPLLRAVGAGRRHSPLPSLKRPQDPSGDRPAALIGLELRSA